MKKTLILMAVLMCLALISCDPANRVYRGTLQINSPSDLRFASRYTSITGNLEIFHEPNSESRFWVQDIDALENLTHVGGILAVGYSILNNLNGLKNLESIGGDLMIFGNEKLADLDGLKKLESIGGGVTISDNDQLTSLEGLRNLTSVGNIITISGNDLLTNLAGLENMTAVNGDLDILSNDLLTSLAGLENITTVGGLDIYNNDKLLQLGLGNLNSVSNNFSVRSNCRLPTSIAVALKNQILDSDGIGGETIIKNNFDDSYPGPVWLGHYSIENHSDLVDLSGYNYVSGNLIISGTTDIIDLTGLENLTRVGGFLKILSNDALTTLFGIHNITSIGDGLDIRLNNALTDLRLDKLRSVGGDFYILQNYSLCDNIALDLKNQVETCTIGGLTGYINISGNKDCSAP